MRGGDEKFDLREKFSELPAVAGRSGRSTMSPRQLAGAH
jgi:hypothetical protein